METVNVWGTENIDQRQRYRRKVILRWVRWHLMTGVICFVVLVLATGGAAKVIGLIINQRIIVVWLPWGLVAAIVLAIVLDILVDRMNNMYKNQMPPGPFDR